MKRNNLDYGMLFITSSLLIIPIIFIVILIFIDVREAFPIWGIGAPPIIFEERPLSVVALISVIVTILLAYFIEKKRTNQKKTPRKHKRK